MRWIVLGISASAIALLLLVAPGSVPFEPTDSYDSRRVEGWTILVSGRLLAEDSEAVAEILQDLEVHLHAVAEAVPAGPLRSLRGVEIWLEPDDAPHWMIYHPDAGWLRQHRMNPAKLRGIVIQDALTYPARSRQQPWAIMHELAHSYHDRVLPSGFENAPVRAAFDHAMAQHLYDLAETAGGPKVRPYASTNSAEYFAEMSQAFFGSNTTRPFDRADLLRHDPEMYRLLCRLWSMH